MSAWREIEIEATPEEVWEALATEEGRDGWLDEPAREIHVESEEAPHRLVWWWWEGDEPPTRVEFLVVAAPAGDARAGQRDGAAGAARPPGRAHGREHGGRPGVTDAIGPVLAALADPTRRHVVETLLREGSTSVPALTAALP